MNPGTYLRSIVWITLACITLAGCATPQRELVAPAAEDQSFIKVLAVREQYGSRPAKIKINVFDYADECPPKKPRTSSSAYRGTVTVGREESEASFSVNGGRRALIRVVEKQRTSQSGRVTCDVGFWFVPEKLGEYILLYSNTNEDCTVSVAHEKRTDRVAIHRLGTCPVTETADETDHMGDLSLRSESRPTP